MLDDDAADKHPRAALPDLVISGLVLRARSEFLGGGYNDPKTTRARLIFIDTEDMDNATGEEIIDNDGDAARGKSTGRRRDAGQQDRRISIDQMFVCGANPEKWHSRRNRG